MFCFFRTLRQCLLGERCFIKYLLYAKEEIVLSVASDTYRPAGGSVESEQEGPEDGDFLPEKAREDFEQISNQYIHQEPYHNCLFKNANLLLKRQLITRLGHTRTPTPLPWIYK